MEINKEDLQALKPLYDIVTNIAIKLLSKKKDTSGILVRLGMEEGRKDFSLNHARVIKIINDGLQKGDVEKDLDTATFYEMLIVVNEMFLELSEKNSEEFKDNITRSIEEYLIDLKLDENSKAKRSRLQYVTEVANKTYNKVINDASNGLINQFKNVEKYMNLNMLSGQDNKKKYTEFYEEIEGYMFEMASQIYDGMKMEVNSSYLNDTFYISLGGHGAMNDIEETVTMLLESSRTPNGRRDIVANIGNVSKTVEISEQLLNVKRIVIDLTHLQVIFSGIITSVQNFAKIVNRNSPEFLISGKIDVRIRKEHEPDVAFVAGISIIGNINIIYM